MSPQPCPFETGLSISFGDRLWRVGGPPTLRAELVNLETALSIWRVGGGPLSIWTALSIWRVGGPSPCPFGVRPCPFGGLRGGGF